MLEVTPREHIYRAHAYPRVLVQDKVTLKSQAATIAHLTKKGKRPQIIDIKSENGKEDERKTENRLTKSGRANRKAG